ncbi:MAG: hypothetical protein WAO95_09165 [Burkholderiales bacterium]
MEIVYFTIVAIGLYVVADAALNALERMRGVRFENRQLVFFAIILPLALLTFWLLQAFGPPAGS